MNNTSMPGRNFGFSNAFGKRKQHQPREKSQYQLNREKELENERIEKTKQEALEVNDFNFPSLGINSWNNSAETENKPIKSFSTLASNWGEQDTKIRNILKNNEEKDLLAITKERLFKKTLPSFNFGSSHSKQEDTYEEEDLYPSYVEDKQASVKTVDEWQTVERKIYTKTKELKKFVPVSENYTKNEEN
jgi:hypothetical protein